MTETDRIVSLISAQADVAQKSDLRLAIRMLNDDWLDELGNAINEQFSKGARERLRPLLTTEINILKKVVDETAQIYKRPAIRSCKVGDTEADRYSAMVAESSLDLVMATAQRYTKAVNHVLLRPVVRESKVEVDIIMPDAFELYVDPDDWKRVVAVKYWTGINYPYSSYGDTKGMKVLSFHKAYLWIAEEAIIGKRTYQPGIYEWDSRHKSENDFEFYDFPYQVNGKNVLPFILTREEFPTEKLLSFTRHSELVTSTVQIGVLLTMLNELKKFASYKQTYITGPTSINDALKGKIAGGPGTLWKMLSDGEGANVGILDATADLSGFMAVIEKRIIMILAQYGIPPSAFTQSGSPVSGYARKIERQALDEARQADIPFWRSIERELFEKMRMVNNRDNTGAKLSEDAMFTVDFDDAEFKPSPDEEIRWWDWQITRNAKTVVDLMRDGNPDLTEEDALKLYERNRALNSSRLSVAPLAPPQ